MKSLQCVELGPPDKLQMKEVSDPQIISDHVIIENKAASVNFPDVLMIQGLYQFQPELPSHQEENVQEPLFLLVKMSKI